MNTKSALNQTVMHRLHDMSINVISFGTLRFSSIIFCVYLSNSIRINSVPLYINASLTCMRALAPHFVHHIHRLK